MAEEFDVLIKNAKIVDGIKSAFTGSIGIKGARVVGVGEVSGDAGTTIDATGLAAMPGFVDSHSHADWSFPWYPRCESAVMQGCTTVVAGQCGGSPGPLGDHIRPPRVLVDETYERSPFLYHPAAPSSRSARSTTCWRRSTAGA
jgi:N-acyl-D-aspartate/D-glutamate deacylase